MNEKKLMIGCVADDFTGASDGASFLKKAGLSVVLLNGIPEDPLPSFSADAAVIALKTRTCPRKEAEETALRAFRRLKELGAEVLYFKYCSTFDSSDEGNIGPVADIVMEELGYPYTVLCPSLPVNGRVVRDGRLYVNGVLLEDSPMRHHPLTPMKKSRLADLMSVQGKYPCVETPMPADKAYLLEEIRKMLAAHGHCYVVPDYTTDAQGAMIAELFRDIGFFTGGSGLMEHIAALCRDRCDPETSEMNLPPAGGPTLILAGSCSAATLGQTAYYMEKGYPAYKLEPGRLLRGELSAEDVWRESKAADREQVLIYSTAAPEEVRQAQQLGKERVSEVLEQTTAQIASIARNHGFKKIIVAGGETSGAVTGKLGYRGFYIGESAAPGVPVMQPLEDPDVRLVLKSGNFGQQDFFESTVRMLG